MGNFRFMYRFELGKNGMLEIETVVCFIVKFTSLGLTLLGHVGDDGPTSLYTQRVAEMCPPPQ